MMLMSLSSFHVWVVHHIGPYFLIPYIGSVLYFMKEDILDKFTEYKKQYGKIFSFSAGDF
jgi:hypothetical protein